MPPTTTHSTSTTNRHRRSRRGVRIAIASVACAGAMFAATGDAHAAKRPIKPVPVDQLECLLRSGPTCPDLSI